MDPSDLPGEFTKAKFVMTRKIGAHQVALQGSLGLETGTASLESESLETGSVSPE